MKLPIAVSLLALLAAGSGARSEPALWNDLLGKGGAPVAKVNGETITLQDLYAEVMERYARQTLSERIQRLLVEQEARKAGVDVANEEVEGRLREVREQVVEEARRRAETQGQDPKSVDADRAFATWVRREYGTVADLRRHLRTVLLSEKIVRGSVTVSQSDLVGVSARLFTISTEKHPPEEAERLAEAARAKLAAGADFATLAREASEDVFARQGGLLPQFRAGDMYLPMEPEALQALLKVRPGEITPVVKGRFGCYVLKLEKLQSPDELDLLTLEEVRQTLLRQRVAASLNTWLQSIKAKAKVEVLDPRFK
ncbi:MAG: peptidylprolyl isomerase [Armatimonadota bacterium]|nr:peptidylprolyl isomerase [Armatimonadota bacterium]